MREVHLVASVSINLFAPFKRATLTEQEWGLAPKSLRTRESTILNNPNTKYLLDTGHQVDTLKSFKEINKQPNSSHLKFTKPISIRHQKTNLCPKRDGFLSFFALVTNVLFNTSLKAIQLFQLVASVRLYC